MNAPNLVQPFSEMPKKSSFAGFVHELARISPRAAYMAALEGSAQPRIISEFVAITNPTPEAPIKKEIQVKSSLFIITDIVYDVTRPTYYRGELGKAQADLANAKSPGVLVSLRQTDVFTGEEYSINCGDDSPIQTVFRHATSNEPTCFLMDWRVAFPQTMNLYVKLSRSLDTAHDGEIPYNVFVTFRGRTVKCNAWEALNGRLRNESDESLIDMTNKRLLELGIAPIGCGSCGG